MQLEEENRCLFLVVIHKLFNLTLASQDLQVLLNDCVSSFHSQVRLFLLESNHCTVLCLKSSVNVKRFYGYVDKKVPV